MRRVAIALAVLVPTVRGSAAAQQPLLRAYGLNVAFAADATPLTDALLSDVQRFRVMSRPSFGPWRLDLAYEHVLSASTTTGGTLVAGLVPAVAGNDWLPLQGTLWETDHLAWRHRVDRLGVVFRHDAVEVTIGRQPISWATTLFLTPADPFAPFDPSDPFREYRAGIDAARIRVFPGPFSEIEAVARVVDVDNDRAVTALARGRTTTGRWEVSGWAGVLHEEAAGAVGVTVTVAGAAIRGEGVLRRTGDETVLRGTVGVDRSFNVGSRTLYVVVEYQRDGFGAANAAELPTTLLSAAARRGELQVFGRDEVVLQGSLEVHPLVSADALVIWNLNDASALLAPGVSYSVTGSLSARAGVFIGTGRGAQPTGILGSEYGLVPTSGYVSLALFL
jgi:hypothetical protein